MELCIIEQNLAMFCDVACGSDDIIIKVYAVSYSAWQSDFFLQSPAIGEPGSAGQAPPLADSGEAGRHSASQTVWHK